MLYVNSLLPEHGLFVEAVLNDPAKSDGRLQPGDEVIEV